MNFGNLLAPCPMRDHHKKATEIINKTNASPQNFDARDALHDEGYHRRLVAYGENFRGLSGKIWETESGEWTAENWTVTISLSSYKE